MTTDPRVLPAPVVRAADLTTTTAVPVRIDKFVWLKISTGTANGRGDGFDVAWTYTFVASASVEATSPVWCVASAGDVVPTTLRR